MNNSQHSCIFNPKNVTFYVF